MSTEVKLSAQLAACRQYLMGHLGHIPEVRCLVRDIDATLQQSEPCTVLIGMAHTSAGAPLLDVRLHGDILHVSSRYPENFIGGAQKLAAHLQAGVTVQLRNGS